MLSCASRISVRPIYLKLKFQALNLTCGVATRDLFDDNISSAAKFWSVFYSQASGNPYKNRSIFGRASRF